MFYENIKENLVTNTKFKRMTKYSCGTGAIKNLLSSFTGNTGRLWY
jgi:predicted double-glycine peptidase